MPALLKYICPEILFRGFCLFCTTPGKEIRLKDLDYMRMALELAEKGQGTVSPNPMVGAIVVKNGRIIGQGYHEYYGGPHGERNAIADCKESPAGATLYVTLEPCCHYGKTPPCTDGIIESGIKRVVVGMRDPNPKVSGKGIEILTKNGIHVDVGLMEKDCRQLNRVFAHVQEKSMPYVALKYAMTLDGKIATATGESKWITGEKAREHVHLLRDRYKAIMAGIGTVIADNPMLNCRYPGGTDPVRVICDTNLRIPLESNIVKTAGRIPTYIAYSEGATEKIKRLEEAGCNLLFTAKKGFHIDLNRLLRILLSKGIDSILCEGGGALNFSLLEEGLVSKIYAYISPQIFGGESAKTPVRGQGVEKLDQAIKFNKPKITALEDDILLECDIDETIIKKEGGR